MYMAGRWENWRWGGKVHIQSWCNTYVCVYTATMNIRTHARTGTHARKHMCVHCNGKSSNYKPYKIFFYTGVRIETRAQVII